MDNFTTVSAAVVVVFLYLVTLGVYRVWFSPVAEIPGPFLAKLTYWYEFYWDVVQVGQYTFHIRDLHDKYGPIIRLNPHEVHIDDPDFYDELNAGTSTGKKRNKWSFVQDSFGAESATFTTIDHGKHRVRRAALNQFFSKAKVRALQGSMEQIGRKVVERMADFARRGEPVPLGLAFTAYTYDIASAYALDVRDFRVDAQDFAPDFHIAAQKTAKSAHLMKQFPWLIKLVQSMPVPWVTAMDPDLGAYMRMQTFCKTKTEEIQAAYRSPDYKHPEQITVLHEILASPHLPEEEKSFSRLWQDAQTVIVAGTLTTATTLSTIFFYLLKDSSKLKRLRQEIFAAFPDRNGSMQLHMLENLPYLTACITEALRISNGVSTRLQRIDLENNMVFRARKESHGSPVPEDKVYIIPAGTPVSMTSLLTHFNPRIYPSPHDFIPERWLEKDSATGNDAIHHKLDKYFTPFSKGTRQCVGINLAWAEVYLLTAMIWRDYGSKEVQMSGDRGYLELYDSSFERDIEIVGDGFIPIVREPNKGIKVKIHPCGS